MDNGQALIWHSTTCSGSNLCNSCICFFRLIETLCFRAALIWSWVEQVMWKRVSKEMWINPKLAIGPSGAVDSLEFVKRHQIWTVKKKYKFWGAQFTMNGSCRLPFCGPTEHAEEVDETAVFDVSREPVILNIYDMFWTNDYTANVGLGVRQDLLFPKCNLIWKQQCFFF